MIVVFQSRASADVIMFGDVAKRLLEIIGREPSGRGILTVEQLPDAIARLKIAIEADKASRAGLRASDLPEMEKVPGGGERPFVPLAQRALPLLELCEWSLRKQVPVVWGM